MLWKLFGDNLNECFKRFLDKMTKSSGCNSCSYNLQTIIIEKFLSLQFRIHLFGQFQFANFTSPFTYNYEAESKEHNELVEQGVCRVDWQNTLKNLQIYFNDLILPAILKKYWPEQRINLFRKMFKNALKNISNNIK